MTHFSLFVNVRTCVWGFQANCTFTTEWIILDDSHLPFPHQTHVLKRFPSMGGWAGGQAWANPWARTPIGAIRISSISIRLFLSFFWYPHRNTFLHEIPPLKFTCCVVWLHDYGNCVCWLFETPQSSGWFQLILTLDTFTFIPHASLG